MYLQENTLLNNGKYQIIRVLGQGGFGITYLARHTMLEKYVAVKEFFPKEYCQREDATQQVSVGITTSGEFVGRLKDKFVKEAKK